MNVLSANPPPRAHGRAEAGRPHRFRPLSLTGPDEIAALRALLGPLASIEPAEGGAIAAISGPTATSSVPPPGDWNALTLAPEQGGEPILTILILTALPTELGLPPMAEDDASALRLEIVAEEVMDAVDAAFGMVMELEAPAVRPSHDHWRMLRIVLADGTRQTMWVGADGPALPRLAAAAAAWPVTSPSCDIRLPTAICTGAIDLPHADLIRLKKGDTILPGPTGLLRQSGHLALGAYLLAPVELTPDGAKLTEDPDMPTNDDGPTTDNIPLDALPVRMEFRLPANELTLDEVRALTAGSVIPLNVDAETPMVDLCIGGRKVGRGEIVDVAGRLAVHVRQTGP